MEINIQSMKLIRITFYSTLSHIFTLADSVSNLRCSFIPLIIIFFRFFSRFSDGLSCTNWTGGVNFVLMLSFAVQWNGLTAQVSVMSSSFLPEMCQHDFAEKWWTILCALLETNRATRTRYENRKFANEYGRAVFNTKSQYVEHETKGTRQTIRFPIPVATAIDTTTE